MIFKMLRGRKRVLVLLVIAAGVPLIILAVVWFLVLPEYRPALRPGEVYGTDVSAHQKPLDWQRVKNDDISFVYVKATEGSGHQDEMFANHWHGARQAGLRTGAYHYFSLCSAGKTQAENYLNVVPEQDDMLPPALDLEFSPFCHTEPSREEVISQVDDWLRLVESGTGKRAILYVGHDFDQMYQIKRHYEDYRYWQLRYLQRPTDARDHIWQIGYFFSVDGAPGKVDLNIGRIDTL